jgi:hypothetical protein
MENTPPAMVIIDPAMIPSTALAPSAPPLNVQRKLWVSHSVSGSSTYTPTNASAMAARAMTAGTNQKLERRRSQYLKSCPLMRLAFLSFG